MSLLVLIPLSIGLGLLGLCAFFWALRNGQFDDPDGAAWRIIPLDPPRETEGKADTRSEANVRDRLQPEDPDAMIAVGQVVATDFATVAAANDKGTDKT